MFGHFPFSLEYSAGEINSFIDFLATCHGFTNRLIQELAKFFFKLKMEFFGSVEPETYSFVYEK